MYNEGWRVVLAGDTRHRRRLFLGPLLRGRRRSGQAQGHGALPRPELHHRRLRPRTARPSRSASSPGSWPWTSADPGPPALVGGTSIFRGVQGIAASGNYVYVTDRWSVKVFDVTDPAKPRAGKPLIFTEGIPRTLVVRGTAGYLTADNFGFYILDFTDPAVPKIVGSFKLPGIHVRAGRLRG